LLKFDERADVRSSKPGETDFSHAIAAAVWRRTSEEDARGDRGWLFLIQLQASD
jgi:hypothetical protein